MRTACPNCNKQLIIREDKIPPGVSFKLVCPECRHLFTVSPQQQHDGWKDTGAEPPAEPPEPDIFPSGAKIALLLLRDKTWSESLSGLLKERDFHVTALEDPAQAISKLHVNAYDVVVVQDGDWSAEVRDRINSWPGTKRRRTNLVLIGDEAKSLHPDISFRKGVDTYLAAQDHARAGELLKSAMEGYTVSCLAWKTATSKLGKEA